MLKIYSVQPPVDVEVGDIPIPKKGTLLYVVEIRVEAIARKRAGAITKGAASPGPKG